MVDNNTFTGSYSGENISWTGQYYEDYSNGYVTITSMNLTWDNGVFKGSSSWEFRNTATGPVVCTGTTNVTVTQVTNLPLNVAPDKLAATALSDTTIRLTWDYVGSGATGFSIERSTSINGTYTHICNVSVNIMQYDDTQLSADTTYYYRVQAYNDANQSDYSNIATQTTLSASGSAPLAPTNLVADVNNLDVLLTWTDVADENGYLLERSTSELSGFAQIAMLGINQTEYTDTGLNNNTTYYYRVRAYNSTGNSSYSSTVSATVSSNTNSVPDTPSAGTATALSSGSILVSWGDVANETGYKIERSTSEFSGYTQVGMAGADAVSYNDTGLEASTLYFYRIRAYNNAGDSGYSTPVYATTQPPAVTVPAAPNNLVANTNPFVATINLTWDDVANENGYRIERSQNQTSGFVEIDTVNADTLTYADSGLPGLTTFYYRIRAYNSAGNSGYSNTSSATTISTGDAAPSLTGPSSSSTGDYTIHWDYTWPGGLACSQDGYILEESSTSPSSGYSEIYRTAANNSGGDRRSSVDYAINGRTNGTYYYRVRAYNCGNGSGLTEWSNVLSVSVNITATVPAAPTNLNGTFTSLSSLDLNWTNNATNATSNVIFISSDGTNFSELGTVSASATSEPITDLPPCTTTYFRIVARNANGDSSPSNSLSAPISTVATIEIQNPGLYSPFFSGTYNISCWDGDALNGGLAKYDTNSNGILDSEQGSNSLAFPRQAQLVNDLSGNWTIDAGRSLDGSANIVLFFRFSSWSINYQDQYISVFLNLGNNSIPFASMWGGDMNINTPNTGTGVIMNNAIGGGGVSYGPTSWSLPSASATGYINGSNIQSFIAFIVPGTTTAYSSGITIIDYNIPIYRE